LTLEEGQEREKFWIEEYKRQGYKILNKAATGRGTSSLGMIGHGKWNRKTCYQEALKYKCASEFENAKGSAYAAALYNGWLKDYTWFETRWEAKWDEKACYEEAKKYKKRGEFQKGSPGAYNKARKMGWIETYDWMSSRNKYPFEYWDDYDHCYNEAKKYHSRAEFEKNNNSACRNARKNGWIDEYTWFKPLTGYWTYEACKAEAAKYEKRGQFKAGCPGAYSKSRINGWLDEFFPKKEMNDKR
jgi:hypothetical protein